MRIDVSFAEQDQAFTLDFGEIHTVSDGNEAVIQPLEVTENGEYTAPDGVDGYSPVVVSVPVPDGYIKPSGSLEITENGTYDVAEKASVTVDVATGGGGGQVGEFTQYAKFVAKPEENTSFSIANPLGGIAKYIAVTMHPYNLTSKRRCRKYIADYNLGIAVGEYSDTDSLVLYASKATTGTVGNGTFKITDGKIVLYRYNSANAWETEAEYMVEIYQ